MRDLFDEEYVLNAYVNEQREEGRAVGREEGREEGRAEGIVSGFALAVNRMRKKPMMDEAIAGFLGMSLSDVQAIPAQ